MTFGKALAVTASWSKLVVIVIGWLLGNLLFWGFDWIKDGVGLPIVVILFWTVSAFVAKVSEPNNA